MAASKNPSNKASSSRPVESMTDEDIAAMPESDYMNDTQIDYFRHKLDRLKQDILQGPTATTEFLREEPLIVPDPVDRATVEEEHTLELNARDRNQAFLEKIDQSLERIDAGEYGYCQETGEPIGIKRLLARPTAALSLEAQERREQRQKMFGP